MLTINTDLLSKKFLKRPVNIPINPHAIICPIVQVPIPKNKFDKMVLNTATKKPYEGPNTKEVMTIMAVVGCIFGRKET